MTVVSVDVVGPLMTGSRIHENLGEGYALAVAVCLMPTKPLFWKS